MAETVRWSKLDNAAKIFPPTSSERKPWVFRVSCQLKDTVEPEMLQVALNKTIKEFPFYTSILRTGLFWYYFEESGIEPLVKKEAKPTFGVLYDPLGRNLLFEVTYFGNRISFEVYHALTDATGAIQFLRTLVYYYLIGKHRDDLGGGITLADNMAALDEKEQDGFSKHYSQGKAALQKQQWAHQMKGDCFPNSRTGIVLGVVPLKPLLAIAKEYGASITEFLTATLLCAFHDGMSVREKDKPVVIVVPVNLRRFFPSETAKNFFSVANIHHSFKQHGQSFEEVLSHVKEQFRDTINEEKMYERLNALYSTEDNPFARIVPLALKNIGLRAAEWISGKQNTASFSNIGRVNMPAELSPYIERFDFFSSAEHLNLCVCSFQDSMSISFSTRYTSIQVQRSFFRSLIRQGIQVRLTSNFTENSEEVTGNAPL